MKKTLIALVLVTALLIVLSTTVLANGGPHGGYSATTDACAGCHRAHTASGPRLLTEASTFDLCMSCHGNTQTGATTNVVDGVLEATAGSNTGTDLNGGGFTNFAGAGTTSTHDVSGTVTDAWGNGVNRGVSAAMSGGDALDCGSCHDPHGSSNYRIIKETINGVGVTVTQVDEGAQVYDAEDWPADMSNVCAACHGTYHVTTAGSGSDAVEAANGGYTHRVDMPFGIGGNVNPETIGYGGYNLPLAGTNLVACSTCHLSHGSSAAMAGFADGGPTGSGTPPGNTTATDSALLRLDNRGTCEVCHQK
ncbi:MAG: cytochrome c3 family protein [Chloroflexota bacterium]